MRRFILVMALLAAAPAAAQGERDLGEGIELFSEGTRQMLRGLMQELEPALRELRERLGGIDAYYPPEILPNGDIIIRRKQPLAPQEDPPEGLDEVGPGDAIDL